VSIELTITEPASSCVQEVAADECGFAHVFHDDAMHSGTGPSWASPQDGHRVHPASKPDAQDPSL